MSFFDLNANHPGGPGGARPYAPLMNLQHPPLWNIPTPSPQTAQSQPVTAPSLPAPWSMARHAPWMPQAQMGAPNQPMDWQTFFSHMFGSGQASPLLQAPHMFGGILGAPNQSNQGQ